MSSVNVRRVLTPVLSLCAIGAAGAALTQPEYRRPPMRPLDWRETEKGVLENHVQLTFDEDFHKAGEAYFSPDGQWIVFQAVPAPIEGEEPDPFYSMYVAKLRYDGDHVTGIDRPIQLSPDRSANTCGWFHPNEEGVVIFGSTVVEPSPTEPPGFQRESSKYKWMFPPETEIVKVSIAEVQSASGGDGASVDPALLKTLTTNNTYDAECAYSPDGRYIVYTSVQPEPLAGDIFVLDTTTGESRKIVEAPGYDGGPFFSPDGTRITYRSDRDGTNLLQVFVADLKFDDDGNIVGIEREYQVTDNEHVNWCPFWHPEGRHLIYATSEVSHFNYEVFIATADSGHLPGSKGPVRYGLQKRRVTRANGFDGLPVFSPDGQHMMWTSQRIDDPRSSGSSQLWIADFVMDVDPDRAAPSGFDEGGGGEKAGSP